MTRLTDEQLRLLAEDGPRLCSVAGCQRPRLSRGYCNAHYKRFERYGDPLKGGRNRPPKGEVRRFFEEVVLTHDADECLFWPHARDRNGYARIKIEGQSNVVSRIVCLEANGLPPDPSYEAAHSCGKGNLGCVAKRHLSWKTHLANEADKLAHGTDLRGERGPSAKLSAAQVLEIRGLLDGGALLHREIADRFGVSRQVIGSIANRKSWADTSAGARLTPDQLHQLAEDSFDILNWARRNGMNKQRQIDELVRTFEIRLGYRAPSTTEPAA